MTYVNLVPNLYAVWHLNELIGVDIADSSGNGRNGTIIGADYIREAGKLNNCLKFTTGIAPGTYGDCGNIANFERTNSFSLECWFKAPVAPSSKIIMSRGKLNAGIFQGYRLYILNGILRIDLVNGAGFAYGTYLRRETVAATYNNNIWYHLIITYDGSSAVSGLKMYVDGIEPPTVVPGTGTLITGSMLNAGTFQIGSTDGPTPWWYGRLDEVVVYDKKLSPEEVTFRYHGGNGRETFVSLPPNIPSNPIPIDTAIDQHRDVNISWTGGHPEGDATTYDIYYQTSSPPSLIVSNNVLTSYTLPSGKLPLTKYYWKIVARTTDSGLTSSGPTWEFTTRTDAPTLPSNPIPTNGLINCPHNQNISWTACTNFYGDPIVYDIYYGETSPPAVLINDHPLSSYTLAANKKALKKYYWKIIAKATGGLITAPGPIWDFTTRNEPPEIPSAPSPSHLAINQDISITLGWTDSDLNTGDTLTYDIYFGEITPPPLVNTNKIPTSLSLSGLAYNKTYYWQIVATDNHGAVTSGPIWQFTTKVELAKIFEVFEPRILVRNAITTSLDIDEDGTNEYVMNISDSNNNNFKVPIYLTEETKSDILPTLPFIELGLLTVSSIPHDICAATRKNEAIIDVHIWYQKTDNVDQVDIAKEICDKINSYIRTYQSTTTGIHFMNLRNTGRVFVETRGRQVIYHRVMELYCLYYSEVI